MQTLCENNIIKFYANFGELSQVLILGLKFDLTRVESSSKIQDLIRLESSFKVGFDESSRVLKLNSKLDSTVSLFFNKNLSFCFYFNNVQFLFGNIQLCFINNIQSKNECWFSMCLKLIHGELLIKTILNEIFQCHFLKMTCLD